MSQYDGVYLSKDDVHKLRRRLIGRGTDGCVYDVGGGLLYKIYHDESYFSNIDMKHPFLSGYEDEDVKIVQKGMYSSIKKFCPHFQYVDGEGVLINGEEIIYLARQKQENIKFSQLPLAPIFVNSRFKGCVLKKHSLHCQLHSLTFMPEAYKRMVMFSIIDCVEELLENCIYHLDLDNYPDDKSMATHSNILVSLFGVPQLIDLDGKSSFYLENENPILLQKCLDGLNFLFLTFYYGLDVPDEILDEDFLELERLLLMKGIPDEYMDDLLYRSCDISRLRKILSNKKINP